MELKLYHTNDIHSHLENWPKIHRFLTAKKKEASPALFFDIGDFIDRVHPLTDATAGQANVRLLNTIPYDAVTIGNNEGTTLTKGALQKLYATFSGDVICANLTDDLGTFQPFVIYERGTEKVAVIALTVIFAQFYELLQWETTDPFVALEAVLPQLPSDVSAIVLMSHLGLPVDEQLAEQFPQLTVILGSHTHHLLQAGKLINGVLLGACGRYGEYIGEVTLNIVGRTVIHKEAQVHLVATLAASPADHLQTEAFFNEGKQLLNQTVAILDAPLSYSWYEESPLSQYVNEIVCEATGADSFLVNAGIYLTALPQGRVTRFDMHQCLPHPLNPFMLHLTGNQLLFLARQIREKATDLRDHPLKGYGFRGQIFGQVLLPRISYDTNDFVLWDNKPLKRDKIYKIVTTDTFIFSPLFRVIRELSFSLESDLFIRNLVEQKLTNETRDYDVND
ncbi:bifunctional metallophosphatase/5'-nucleotidase [Brochothrix campestris]|uniref:bifunctional metallophosphatase/5'-nucleotidase n=1 Tax=Brochothrix campestris TaxID=2757 RepID=UPI0038D20E35